MPASNLPYRKLTRTGNGSYYVIIPPEIVRALHWRERQKLTVRQKGRSVMIEDFKEK